jgi:four helix bundle protein
MLIEHLMVIQSYEDLVVWQLSMRLAKEVETIAARLPAREQFGLALQLRRASTSIPSNIAEGSTRPTLVYINHLRIALGSEAETKTQLKLAASKKFVTESEIEPLLALASQIGRMLHGLVRSLKAHLAKQQRRRQRPDP